MKKIKKLRGVRKAHPNRPTEEQLTFTRSWADPTNPDLTITFTMKPKTKRLKQEGVFYKVRRKRDPWGCGIKPANWRRKKIVAAILTKRTGLQHPTIISTNHQTGKLDMHTYKVMKYAYKRDLERWGILTNDEQIDNLIQVRIDSVEPDSAKKFLTENAA
jgi:hypothetical protein